MLEDEPLLQAWQFLTTLSPYALVSVFWFTVIFEIPRYFFRALATLTTKPRRTSGTQPPDQNPAKASIIIACHNEEAALDACVASLREQSYPNIEIICIDDGSTDRTFERMQRMERAGLVDCAVRCQLRGGKSSGLNLGARMATGDFLIVVDCDCSFEREAIAALLRPLADPRIMAVSGNILIRNWKASIVTSLQAIEYLNTISLGKSATDLLNQVSCVSGAFGAFRRDAWLRAGGMDVGPGEDFDFTMRLRLAGGEIAFAPAAVCYTDGPETLLGLARQRNRWERDAFWIRFRKFYRTLAPMPGRLLWRETLHQLDFLFFNVACAAVFPFYLLILFMLYGQLALVIALAASLGYYILDGLFFTMAVWFTGKSHYWRLAPFLLIYGPFQSYVMRFIRLHAYVDEWIFSRSREDNYVPEKVRAWSAWR